MRLGIRISLKNTCSAQEQKLAITVTKHHWGTHIRSGWRIWLALMVPIAAQDQSTVKITAAQPRVADNTEADKLDPIAKQAFLTTFHIPFPVSDGH